MPPNDPAPTEGTPRPPDPPHSLEVTSTDSTSAQLKWKSPLNDGGSPIKGYFLQFRQSKEQEWEESLEQRIKPAKCPTGEVSGLATGCKYEFRVLAFNREGKSDPSEPTLPQTIKALKAPPKIDRSQFNDDFVIRNKTNSQLTLEVTVHGAPAPVTSWWLDGKEVRSEGDLKVSHPANLARLVFIRSKRCMRGKYLLKAKNDYGEDSLEIDIQIYGRPDAPKGPLEVSEVTKRTCLLRWEPPLDDGGDDAISYELEKKEESCEQWLPVGKTKETFLEVKSLSEGKSYFFLVRAVNRHGDSPDLITEKAITAKNQFESPGEPGTPEICDWGPDFADLRWNTPEDDGGTEITSYRIEVRDREKRGWMTAGISAESDAIVTDNISEGGEFEFRVVAVNVAGESACSRTSKAIVARQRFVKPKIVRETLGEKVVYASQGLRVSAEVKGEPRPKVSWWAPNGVKLEDGDRCRIEEGETNVLMMKGVGSKDGGVYKIKAKNSEGSDEVEFKVTVIGPPSSPIGPLDISDVSSNSCTLSWKRPESDGGSQIKTYSVEKRNVEKDEWIPCGQVGGKVASVMKQLDCKIINLIQGEVYMFRVIACNSQGESEPLECYAPVCARPAVLLPEKPSAPKIKDIDRKWVNLEWEVSTDEDITHYVIEKLEQFMVPKVEEKTEEVPSENGLDNKQLKVRFLKGPSFSGEFQEYCSKWMTAAITDGPEGTAKISDLAENHKYSFRIKAVNPSGVSEPSDATKEILCKEKQRPVINREMLKQVVVSKGENAVLQVRFSGDPVPERSWFLGKTKLKPSASVLIEDKDHSSKLTLLGSSKRTGRCQYEFRVENEFGQETALIDVVIKEPPGKPKGPMKIDKVHAQGCICSWQQSEEDGGSPITHYVIERLSNSNPSWKSCGRSTATSFQVTDLTPDREYRLRVKAVNSEGESEPLSGVDSFIAENPFCVPSAPGVPEMVDGDVDHFVMAWDAPRNDGRSRITGYQLEARKWKESGYFHAGEVRNQIQKGEVRNVELGQSYAVRVRAVNAAGSGPWSMDSEQLVVKHRALAPKVKSGQKELVFKEGEKVEVCFEVQAEPPSKDVSFTLGDKNLFNEPSQGVRIEIKPYQARLEISSITRKMSGTLTCTAQNRHGKGSSSIQIHVQAPPSAPEGVLEVKEVHRNGCKLQWQASRDDGGLPVQYVIERQTSQNKEPWKRISSTTNTQLALSDLKGGMEYEFQVRAVNALGESEAVKTAKGVVAKDKFTCPLPPGAPEIVSCSDRHMDLKWAEPLDDGGAPVQGYRVESRLNGCGEWQLFETLNRNCCEASMHNLNEGTEYQFRVIAINKAGKSEPSHPSRSRKACAQHVAPSIDARDLRDLKVEAGSRVKLVAHFKGEPTPQVTWTKEGSDDRPIESSRSQCIDLSTTTSSTKLTFSNISRSQDGTYILTAVNESGRESVRVSIIVRDRPSPPENLTATLKGSLCRLEWKRPKDDGGAAVEYYQVERSEVGKEGWLACGRTKEVEFEAKGLLVGREYRFRLTAVNKYGYSEGVETKEGLSVMSE